MLVSIVRVPHLIVLADSLCQGCILMQLGPELRPLHQENKGHNVESVVRHIEIQVHIQWGISLVIDVAPGHLKNGEAEAHYIFN